MKNVLKYLFSLVLFSALLASCTKEVFIDIPEGEQKLVVEGFIITNSPPVIFLSKSQSFNDPIDPEGLANTFVSGASVEVHVEGDTYELEELCVSTLSPTELELAAELLGLSVEEIQAIDLCVYTSLDFFGEEGKTYDLTINAEGESISSRTKIDYAVPLDSLWFEIWGDTDSLGFIWGILTDPDTAGNNYRWYSQRINAYPNEPGVPKDSRYIPPSNSVSEDSFFDGLQFEFGYNRGQEFNSNKVDDNNDESFFFKVGDTIAVRPVSIRFDAYRFYRGLEEQVTTNGSPFSLPENIESNIEGGLGIWAGFGPTYDTIICTP
ncbi:MAG: DUF4249 domain-containing protein [Bacteroidota bacterium]